MNNDAPIAVIRNASGGALRFRSGRYATRSSADGDDGADAATSDQQRDADHASSEARSRVWPVASPKRPQTRGRRTCRS